MQHIHFYRTFTFREQVRRDSCGGDSDKLFWYGTVSDKGALIGYILTV